MSFLDDSYGQSLIIVTLLIAYVTFQATIEHKKFHLLHETGFGIIIGFLIGMIFNFFDHTIQFSGEKFFEIILPPIIFCAGYNLKKKKFFENFFYITLYAVVGTLICFFITLFITQGLSSVGVFVDLNNEKIDLSSEDILYFSATMCASDSIAALTLINSSIYPKLFSIVFGEGMLNDAVAIILFKSVGSIVSSSGKTHIDSSIILDLFLSFLKNFTFSVLIGVLMAVIATIITKKFRFLVADPIKENIFLLLIGYATYCLAELVDVSNVISLLTSGILMSHYMRYNMSEYGKISTGITVGTLSQISESFLFIYLGMTSWNYMRDKSKISLSFIGLSFIITCVSRFGCIFIPSAIAYLFKRKNWAVNMYELWIIWFAGLIRGAVAFALICTVSSKLNPVVVSTILFIVFFTTVILGAMMPCYIKYFIKKMSRSEKIKIRELLLQEEKKKKRQQRVQKPNLLKKLDEEVLKPLFIFDYYNRKADILLEKQKQNENNNIPQVQLTNENDDIQEEDLFDPGNNPVLSEIKFIQNQRASIGSNMYQSNEKKSIIENDDLSQSNSINSQKLDENQM